MSFRKNKFKRIKITVCLTSVHTSEDIQEQFILQECLIEKFKTSENEFILGQDSNDQIGIVDEIEEEESRDINIGRFCIKS